MASSTFASNGLILLDQLETRAKKIIEYDPDFLVTINKGIEEAKILLGAGKPTEAEQKYADTVVLVDRAEAQESTHAEARAFQLMWIELAYLALLLLVGYFSHMHPNYWLWNGLITLGSATAWYGALGGVAIALFGLYSHIQARDFDPKYRLWYLCKPIIGAIFGWFVAFIYLIGLVAVQGTAVNPTHHELFFVIAFLAGFSERFTVKITDRIMQVLTTWQDNPASGSNVPQTK